MEIILIAIVGTLNIVCFFVGAKVGQMTSNGKDINVPTINPMKAVREHRADKEAEMKRDRMDTILRNIDRYDGTSAHQEDVPR